MLRIKGDSEINNFLMNQERLLYTIAFLSDQGHDIS